MPSRQLDLRVWPGSLGSALEPQAEVSRLLPGAPWPGLGARGFRCTAAGCDALLLRSSRGFSTTQLQVGPASFSPAPRPRLHPRGPAARCWGLDSGPRPFSSSSGACWWLRARAMPGQACPLPQIPRLGRSHSPDFPRTPGIRAPACTAPSPSSPGQGWLLRGSRG